MSDTSREEFEEPFEGPVREEPRGRRLALLSLGALGVVYGDIGTSPLYALRECFAPGSVLLTHDNVLGVLSLILWSLLIVITLKYLMFVLRADNQGEGGILALMTLVVPREVRSSGRRSLMVMLGIVGAALLYGDGMITPAISVLSAVEGLGVATPLFDPYVIPIAVIILIGLFSVQKYGTGAVGAVFGPMTLIWFSALAAMGVHWILQVPEVLQAINPWLAAEFFLRNGHTGFEVLGAVFLVVTGGEALYADMGHFGRRPIRLAWAFVVLPALILNYFGQGALLLADPTAVHNPFFRLAPAGMVYPLVVLATAATIIASQAVISGAFSLTRQALQLGFLPRVEVRHSSAEEVGQVYAPFVNWALLVATIGLVVGFGSSAALAGAYGIAVSLTMVITTFLAAVCARRRGGWSMPVVVVITAGFFVVDMAFFSATSLKILNGGWLPVLVAAVVYLAMSTWRRGNALMAWHSARARLSVEYFLGDLDSHPLHRVPGTAVFLDARGEGVPRTLLHNIKHYKVLHQRVVLLTLVTDGVPHVPTSRRVEIQAYRPDFVRVIGHYGFMETPNVPQVLDQARAAGLEMAMLQTTFFFGRETLLVRSSEGMPAWRKHLFSLLFRNSYGAQLHFGIPVNRVVEVGQQVEL